MSKRNPPPGTIELVDNNAIFASYSNGITFDSNNNLVKDLNPSSLNLTKYK